VRRELRIDGRKLGRQATMIAAVATALRTGKRVHIAATSEAEAKRLMDAARELIREGKLPVGR
jgi:ornithine cyclodeaminase/alanine dehydrogenase-like protein (mu-crystallin family)